MSYSQLNQDLNVLNFYNNKKNGFFIEIGASDGIELSNTYLLEKKYNWRGICVEPIPEKFNLLLQNRSKSYCCNKPIFSENEKIVIFSIPKNKHMLSGINEYIDRYKSDFVDNVTQLTLKTITLNELLRNCGAPSFIEYLSLDTEGTELEILKSVDFTKYTFGLIDVEHNYVEPRRSQMREFLTSNGYVYLRENCWDDCYKHNSL